MFIRIAWLQRSQHRIFESVALSTTKAAQLAASVFHQKHRNVIRLETAHKYISCGRFGGMLALLDATNCAY